MASGASTTQAGPPFTGLPREASEARVDREHSRATRGQHECRARAGFQAHRWQHMERQELNGHATQDISCSWPVAIALIEEQLPASRDAIASDA
eukprot:2639612-Prymnesium_polylepis.2